MATTPTPASPSSGPLEDVGNLVNYLVGDPVQQTHDDFMQLGRRLAEMGRFPERRPSLQLRMPALLRWYAAPQALISAEVVPFRPHRGVLVVVEEPVGEDISTWLRWLHTDHHPAVLETPGVAGVWMYGSTSTWTLHPATQGDPQHTTVIYLDDDPLTVTQGARAAARGTVALRCGATAVRRSAEDDDRLGGMAMTVKLSIGSPVVTLTPGTHGAWEATATIEDLVRVAETVDRLGYHHMTCSEHIGVPATAARAVIARGYWDPLSTFGYLAARTRRIRFATYVLVLGYHHPLEYRRSATAPWT